MSLFGATQEPIKAGKRRFDCPSCARKSGWTKNGEWWRCDHRESCGAKGRICSVCEHPVTEWGRRGTCRPCLSGEAASPRPACEKSAKKTVDGYPSGSIGNTTSAIPAAARPWLGRRLPGLDLDDARRRGLIGDPGKLGGGFVKHRIAEGYGLFIPLFPVDEPGRPFTGQLRWTGAGAPTFQGAKAVSVASYRERSLTFGRLDRALEAARETGRLYIFEGIPDTLTGMGAGLGGRRDAVGVPGAAQLGGLARHLASLPELPPLIIIGAHRDQGGDEGAAAFLAALEDRPEAAIARLPWPAADGEALDLNDILERDGAGFVADFLDIAPVLVRQARTLTPYELQQRRNEERREKLNAVGCLVFPAYMRQAERERLLAVARGAPKLAPIRRLSRAATCGEFVTHEVAWDSAGKAHSCGKHTRVGETTACSHCSAARWNRLIGPAIIEDWPAKVFVGLVDFPAGDLAKAKKIKRLAAQMTKGDPSGSFACFIDPQRHRVVIVLGPAAMGTPGEMQVRGLCTLEEMSREAAARSFIAPAWMGWAEYVSASVRDANKSLNDDPFFKSRWERYMTRAGLALPTEATARSLLRAEPKPEPEEVPGVAERLFVTYSRRSRRVVAITMAPLSYGNITRSQLGQPMSFLPGEPGNLLDSPGSIPYGLDVVLRDVAQLEGGAPLLPPPMPNSEDWRRAASDEELWARRRRAGAAEDDAILGELSARGSPEPPGE